MPATAIAVRGVRPRVGGDRLLDQVADVGGEVLQLVGIGGVRGQVALGMADGAGLQRGVEVDLLPVPTISSVEPPPMSKTRVFLVGALGGRPQVGEVGLLLAGEKLGVEVEALAQLGDEGIAVAGVADGAGRDRHHPLGAQLLIAGPIVGDHVADVARSRPRRGSWLWSTPRPRLVTVVRRSTSSTSPASTSPISSPGRVGADVDYGYPHRLPQLSQSRPRRGMLLATAQSLRDAHRSRASLLNPSSSRAILEGIAPVPIAATIPRQGDAQPDFFPLPRCRRVKIYGPTRGGAVW